jgi:hypothetical protein
LQIEDRVCRVSLTKEGLPGLQLNDSTSQSGVGQKGGGIENGWGKLDHIRSHPGNGCDAVIVGECAPVTPCGLQSNCGDGCRFISHRQEHEYQVRSKKGMRLIPSTFSYTRVYINFILEGGGGVCSILLTIRGNNS